MSASNLRAQMLRRSQVREYVTGRLTEDQVHTHDVSGIVMDLTNSEDTDFEFTAAEWAAVLAPHEYDENGLTDAALAKALKNSRTGWVVLIRRPNADVETLNWTGATDATPESIEGLLREFMRLPEGTTMMVLPLVG